jgi:hypothetical protein
LENFRMDPSTRRKFSKLVCRACALLLDPKAAAAVLKRSKRKAAPKARTVKGRNRAR